MTCLVERYRQESGNMVTGGETPRVSSPENYDNVEELGGLLAPGTHSDKDGSCVLRRLKKVPPCIADITIRRLDEWRTGAPTGR